MQDQSLELKFLNSAPVAALNLVPQALTKFTVSKSQTVKSARHGEYKDLHWHRLDEHSPLTFREVEVDVRKVLAVPSTSVFLVSAAAGRR